MNVGSQNSGQKNTGSPTPVPKNSGPQNSVPKNYRVPPPVDVSNVGSIPNQGQSKSNAIAPEVSNNFNSGGKGTFINDVMQI